LTKSKPLTFDTASADNHHYQGILMKTYICIVCGFVYDEAAGRPEDGIAPGTVWADVPAGWACPDCGVAKADFEAVEL
jgi:rubredoxin